MIRQFFKGIVADLTHAVARSELAAENARLRAELEQTNAVLKKWQDEHRSEQERRVAAQEGVYKLDAQVADLRARLSATCPADGMSDREVSINISTALYHNNDGWADHEAGGAAARELFGRPAR